MEYTQDKLYKCVLVETFLLLKLTYYYTLSDIIISFIPG